MTQESEKYRRTLQQLCKNNCFDLHCRKTVYRPGDRSDDLFGSLTAISNLSEMNEKNKYLTRKTNTEQKKSKNNNSNTLQNSNSVRLEVASREMIYHKHDTIVRNIDYIGMSNNNFDCLLNFLGHESAFSYILKGTMYCICNQDNYRSSTEIGNSSNTSVVGSDDISLIVECYQLMEENVENFSQILVGDGLYVCEFYIIFKIDTSMGGPLSSLSSLSSNADRKKNENKKQNVINSATGGQSLKHSAKIEEMEKKLISFTKQPAFNKLYFFKVQPSRLVRECVKAVN